MNSTPKDTLRFRQILQLTGRLVQLTVWLEEFELFASQSVITNREKFAKRLGMRGFEVTAIPWISRGVLALGLHP